MHLVAQSARKRDIDVIMVCQEAEKCFGTMLVSTTGGLPHCKDKGKPIF